MNWLNSDLSGRDLPVAGEYWRRILTALFLNSLFVTEEGRAWDRTEGEASSFGSIFAYGFPEPYESSCVLDLVIGGMVVDVALAHVGASWTCR